eukprot:267275-Ditylum_brightwellii.AAC.1
MKQPRPTNSQEWMRMKEEIEHQQPDEGQVREKMDMQITGVHDQEQDNKIAGAPHSETNEITEEVNSETEGQENSPIKLLKEVFNQANNMLQGELREI